MQYNTFEIRFAVIDEHPQLIELQRRASLANLSDRDVLLANPDAVFFPSDQIESGQVVVAEYEQLLVGFATVLPRNDGDSELDALFVEPMNWRMGIGRALLEHCCRIARLNGSNVLHVIGNPHAEIFYENCGFRQTGVTKTRFGCGLLMERSVVNL